MDPRGVLLRTHDLVVVSQTRVRSTLHHSHTDVSAQVTGHYQERIGSPTSNGVYPNVQQYV